MSEEGRGELLSVGIIQSNLHWEDVEPNLFFFESEIKKLRGRAELIVLPETFSTGFTMNAEKFSERGVQTLDWMVRMAKVNRIYLAGSLITKDKNQIFNRLYCINPEGNIDYYDKRHLFRMGREQDHFVPGKRRVIIKIGQFRVLLQICYDLRFPVFARNRGDYDVILYVANWPTAREKVWDTLLQARAIENQSYVIAANRSGTDGEGVSNCGKSCLIGPTGEIKARLNDQPGLLISSLDLNELNVFRNNFQAYKDADDFILNL